MRLVIESNIIKKRKVCIILIVLICVNFQAYSTSNKEELVTPYYELIVNDKPKKMIYKNTEINTDNIDFFLVKRSEVYFKIMAMSKEDIIKSFFYDWGGVDYGNNPELESNDFILALIRKGFSVEQGCESGQLVIN